MKRAVALIALIVALPIQSARAHQEPHPFMLQAAVPCATVCANWEIPAALGYSPCAQPFPEGSYRDVLTEPAPQITDPIVLEVTIRPEIDWDLYVCSWPDRELLATGANLLASWACRGLAGHDEIPVGCDETASVLAEPGKQYLIRGFNWSDHAACPGSYRWIVIAR